MEENKKEESVWKTNADNLKEVDKKIDFLFIGTIILNIIYHGLLVFTLYNNKLYPYQIYILMGLIFMVPISLILKATSDTSMVKRIICIVLIIIYIITVVIMAIMFFIGFNQWCHKALIDCE